MQLLEEIRDALRDAEKEKKKTATLHTLVLLHAAELESIEPLEFCRRVHIQETYQTEFRKMIAVSHRLAEFGYDVQKKAKA
ncbi:MAG: hypothetical protein HZA93_07130 [Verrucomicrobia bacterium]|nr:hypothetical protein [Verrucomicrobiota bacterium]